MTDDRKGDPVGPIFEDRELERWLAEMLEPGPLEPVPQWGGDRDPFGAPVSRGGLWVFQNNLGGASPRMSCSDAFASRDLVSAFLQCVWRAGWTCELLTSRTRAQFQASITGIGNPQEAFVAEDPGSLERAIALAIKAAVESEHTGIDWPGRPRAVVVNLSDELEPAAGGVS